MQMYKIFPLFAALFLLVVFPGCKKKLTSGSASFEELLFNYTADDDQIIITPAENITPFSRCNDFGDLELLFLRVPDTVEYSQDGSTLKFVDVDIAQGIVLVDNSVYFFEDTNLVVQQRRIYQRDGKGDGLSGLWRFAGFEYFYLEGDPTARDDSVLNADLEQLNDFFVLSDLELNDSELREIPARSFLVDREAQLLEEDLLFFFSGVLAVSRDENVISLIGVTTSEILTITVDNEADKEWILPVNREKKFVWESSSAGHGDHVFYENPVVCPNSFVPEWWEEFLDENTPGAMAPLAEGRRPFLAFEQSYPELVQRRKSKF